MYTRALKVYRTPKFISTHISQHIEIQFSFKQVNYYFQTNLWLTHFIILLCAIHKYNKNY